MYAPRYFAPRYFAPRYWPPGIEDEQGVIVAGPYYVAIAQAFVPGAAAVQSFVPGAAVAISFVPGAVAAQGVPT